MTTCNIVGCPCEGTNDSRRRYFKTGDRPHHAIKAHRYGFTYFAASYGPRYGDPSGTYVSLLPGKAEDAADRAAEFERSELDFDDIEAVDNVPDVCVWGESTYAAKDLFSAVELRENRRALLNGEVICLSR